MIDCLARHMRGDWGCVDDEDAKTNEEAVRSGSRILSAYPIGSQKPCKGFGDNTLWIITEADRSVTTFLLSEEYKDVPMPPCTGFFFFDFFSLIDHRRNTWKTSLNPQWGGWRTRVSS
jgi:hypothetical protein